MRAFTFSVIDLNGNKILPNPAGIFYIILAALNNIIIDHN